MCGSHAISSYVMMTSHVSCERVNLFCADQRRNSFSRRQIHITYTHTTSPCRVSHCVHVYAIVLLHRYIGSTHSVQLSLSLSSRADRIGRQAPSPLCAPLLICSLLMCDSATAYSCASPSAVIRPRVATTTPTHISAHKRHRTRFRAARCRISSARARTTRAMPSA